MVLAALDEIEGYRADDPDRSLYLRQETEVRLPDGTFAEASVYFYNAPLGRHRALRRATISSMYAPGDHTQPEP